MKQANIEKKQLNELILWDKNPRAIHEVDYKRLKNLIKELGLFKPFLVNQDNIILGGNMRYRVCKDLGYKEVYASIVETNNETEMFAYALADNDRAGYYEEDKVAELVLKNPTLKLDMYKLDLGYNSPLEDVVKLFSPNIDDFENLSEEDLEKYLEENQWGRVLFSNLLAIPVDSVIFAFIAFWGILPVSVIWSIILANILVKSAVSAISFPSIYLIPDNLIPSDKK